METVGDEGAKGSSTATTSTAAVEVEPGPVVHHQEPHPVLVPVSAMLEATRVVEPQMEPQVQEEAMEVETQVVQVEQEHQQNVVHEEVATTTEPIPDEVVGSAMEMVTEEEIVGELITGENMEEPVDDDEEEEEAEEQEEVTIDKLGCNLCEQKFTRQSHLTRHIESCHGDRGIYTCEKCSATFNRKDSLSRHMVNQHGESPRYVCTVPDCDKDFSRRDYLSKHLKTVHKLETLEASGGVYENEATDADDQDEGETLTIMEVSSLVLPMATNLKDKRYKCTNTGCDAEYNTLEHLHRHLSRGHTSEMQLPVWGHSIFGLTELKMEAGNEGESMLCMFCCTSYQHNKEIEKQRKSVLANDPGFTRFCEAALRQQRKRMSANTIIKSLNSLKKLSVCQRCFNKIGYAMGTKVAADEVESRVEELRRQLDNELKNLQSEVEQFHAEMKTIEDVIRKSDMGSLEDYLKRIEGAEEKEQSSVVLLLRDGIFAVMQDVELYCRRIKGQQIVVNTPMVRRRSEGKGMGGNHGKVKARKLKKKRGRKGKGINPMMHVKVEHGQGEEADEDEEDKVDGDTQDETDGGAGGGEGKKLELDTTPRRQPKRKARVRTEEFLKSLFEKQEEDLEAVVKTEVISDAEEEKEPGEAVEGQEEVEKGGEGDKDKKDEEGEKGKDKEKPEEVASTAAAAKASASVEDEGKKGDKENQPKEKPPIEEILIEGDDDLDDLVYEGETSDEDFHIDAAHDDFDSGSQSSSSESEESDEGEDSEEDDEPKPKRARGRPAGRRTKKSDFDPFNFKKTRKNRAAKTRSNSKLAQMHNIDMSHMSDFRKRLLCRILKKNSKAPTDPLTSGEPDPRVNFRYEYDVTSDSLILGDVHVIIHDDHNSLQCSKCGYLSSPAEKPRRSVPRLMYNHILGKHLYAFQCPQCSATLGSYRRYLDHIKGHQMGFQCDICGKPLFSEEALRRHKWGHMNAEEMAEAIRQGVKDPRRKHDPTQSFQCTACGKVFTKKMLLRQHEKTHAENRERIVCTLCGKTFLPSGFISHQKYSCFPEGYEPPRVQCQLCPSTFKSVVLRARHMKYAHSSASVEKPFKCHICGKGFAANEHLQKHIKRHSDARPYLCRKGCGANYKTRKDCTRHEKKCEGSGTPMMRHKGRNDSLSAPPQPIKQEPQQVLTAAPSQTVMITSVQGHMQVPQGPPPPIIIQTQTITQAVPPPATVAVATAQAPPPPQQYNVYNIL